MILFYPLPNPHSEIKHLQQIKLLSEISFLSKNVCVCVCFFKFNWKFKISYLLISDIVLKFVGLKNTHTHTLLPIYLI